MTDITFADGVRPHSSTSMQGALLAFFSLVTVVGGVMLAPILPSMVAHYEPFNDAAEAKVLISMGLPGLMVGLFANHIGLVLDRYGRKNILLISLFGFGIVGMFPVLVDDLNLFVVSRVLLGIFEAAVMVSSSTMLGDYFMGKERQKWFIRQTIIMAVAGIVFVVIGGALGQIAWNAPFYMYGMFLLTIPFAWHLLYEPEKHAEEAPVEKFPWDKVRSIYLFGFIGAILIIVIPIQLGFILTERGITSSLTIGMTNMVHSAALLIGAVAFRFRKDASFKVNLSMGFILIAIGTSLVGAVENYWVTVGGAFLAGAGAGFAMPTMITEVMRHLSFEWRGRGNGRWNASFFFGAFVSPLIVISVSTLVGSLSLSIAIMGAIALVMVGAVAVLLKSRVGLSGIDG